MASMTREDQKFGSPGRRTQAGMTLIEVVVAMGISAMAVAAIVTGYIFTVTSTEKSSLSLAASARASERIEETRSAKWDTASSPPVDQLVSTNFPDQVVTLDLSGSGQRVTYATNMVQISQISTSPPLKRIRVDCVWAFKGPQLVTNTIETCRAPDQ
jgi:prepilin-type N-terminal cleavage/methylation domain-containing protein